MPPVHSLHDPGAVVDAPARYSPAAHVMVVVVVVALVVVVMEVVVVVAVTVVVLTVFVVVLVLVVVVVELAVVVLVVTDVVVLHRDAHPPEQSVQEHFSPTVSEWSPLKAVKASLPQFAT